MEHSGHNHGRHEGVKVHYTVRDFVPLIVVFAVIFTFAALAVFTAGGGVVLGVQVFMGVFFLVFGGLKIANWRGFADAYGTYDIIARHSRVYGYTYPLIELLLGVLYLTSAFLAAALWTTLALMLVSAAGVLQSLLKKDNVQCACLGAVFTVPLTWVTLAEDLLMAGMAAWMLIL